MAYAPASLRWLADQWEAAIPSAVFSGIVGDSRHDYGYHRAPNEIPRSDYSLQLPGDRPEDGIDMNAADGLDMSMSTADMILVTGRIYRSWLDQVDPRLNYQREAIGTLDGSTVIYMDCQLAQRGTADNSHLWHVHVGGLRIHANNMDAMRALLSVIKGETVAQWQAGDNDMATAEATHNLLSEGWSILTGANAGIIPNEAPGHPPINVGNPLWDMLRAIAKAAGTDAGELAAIEAAAQKGTEAAMAAKADEFVAAILAGLPEGTLTRADVEAALRDVIGSVRLTPGA